MVAPVVAPSSDPLEGKRLGRFRLVQQLAQGGMATVYLARQEGPGGFERPVAIKVVHPHLAREPRFASMFLDEARLTGQLHHPNVCSVVEFGDEGGQLYLVMEYLHGETFARVIRRGWKEGGALPAAIVARILADAARGLHAAHELRDPEGKLLEIVHRDVSPQNLIVLYDGHTKLTDFGIARARGRLTDTATGELKGKISFMSPEQLHSANVDRRTDVWALGVVAWEALCGKRLFRAANEGATALNVVNAKVEPPSSIVPDVPPALDRAVMRALDRDLGRRTATAAQLADELEEYLYSRGRPLGAAEISSWMEAHFGDRMAERGAALAGRASFLSVEGISASGSLHDAKTTAKASSPGVGTLEESLVRVTSTGERKQRAQRRWGIGAMIVGAVIATAVAAMSASDETAMTASPLSEAEPTSARIETATHPIDAPEIEPASGSIETASPIVAPTSVPQEVASPTEIAEPPIAHPEPPPVETRPVPREPIAPVRPHARATRPREPAAPRAPGQINLLAIPPAEVFLRGRSLGRTPLVRRELPAGTHVLELREVGGARRERVRVEILSDQRTDRAVRFD